MNKSIKQFANWLWFKYGSTKLERETIVRLRQMLKTHKKPKRTRILADSEIQKKYHYPDKMPKYFRSARLV